MRVVHFRVRRRGSGEPSGTALAAAWSSVLASTIAAPEWRPPCDVVESAEEWRVTAELGGLAEDDVEILLYEDSLVVQGVRPWRGALAGVRVHLAEVRYGAFRFALDLPTDAERASVRASYERGMLIIVLPKSGARGHV